MKRIKVLHILEPYIGGVPKYLELLFKYNDNSLVNNIVICSINYDTKKILKYTHQIYKIPMKHKIVPLSDLMTINKIRKIIKNVKPDIIYAHSSKAGAFARIADLEIKNKVIYNPHGWAFNTQPSIKKRKIYKLAEKILSYFCDDIVCISDAEKKTALKNNICKPSKLKVIYSGIDLKKIKKVKPKNRKELDIPQNAFVVGFVGRLTKLKSPDIFIKAAKLIKNEIPNAYFLIVGDGELRHQVENMIDKYKLNSSFNITGWIENPISYIKVMNVGVLLSRWWEGFGLVLPEYMITNVPIIATDVGAIPNIVINNKSGILVHENNYREVANAIIKLYENSLFRNQLINYAHTEAINRFDERRVMLEHLNLYRRLTNENSFKKEKL